MNMIVRQLGASLLLMISIVSSLQGRDTAARPASLAPRPQRCIALGAGIDSSFAVAQARKALSRPGVTLAPRLIQTVRDEGIELGLLISLVSTNPPSAVGGGGMVWVDLDTGCAIVLRRYE
jgi:hypothetical protein